MNRYKREVSRERLIGISFIDILIQAIFVLFLALGVGYMDPTEREEAERAKQNLHDICHRFNKDSTKPCYDYLVQMAAKEAKEGKGSLHLCIAPKSFNKATPSAFFKVHSPTQIRFLYFSPEYKAYLLKNGQTQKLKKVQAIRAGLYPIGSIESIFGFIREEKCYHKIERGWEKDCKWYPNQLSKGFQALLKLEEFSSEK